MSINSKNSFHLPINSAHNVLPDNITYKNLIERKKCLQAAIPRCKHFGVCGGCRFQDVPYELQISWKEDALSVLLERDVSVTPSPQSYGYRSRMDFVAAFGNIGLRPKGRHDKVIDIEYCHLIQEQANAVLHWVRYWREKLATPDFNYLKHEGFLRYAVLRQTSTDDTMLVLVTKNPHTDQQEFIPRLAEKIRIEIQVTSLWWILHDGLADLSYGIPYRFWGEKNICEQYDRLQFLIGPNTFFQSNSFLAKECFAAVKGSVYGSRILDLYCGTGVITLLLHENADTILGVDSNDESIILAEKNANQNEVTNVCFICSDVRHFLIHNSERFDTVVLDPPRSGAGKKVMRRILKLMPQRIIYMSCNPDTFKQDSQFLEGYRMISILGYDMFPHTPHVELIGVFDREK